MSQYLYLVCESSRRLLWLGKAVWRVEARSGEAPARVSRGPKASENSDRELMNRVLWKFLAESAGKNIRVAFEHQLDPALDYIEIGGDSDNAISFDDYLAMEPPQNDSAGKLSVASSVGDLSVATEKEVPTEENEVPEIED